MSSALLALVAKAAIAAALATGGAHVTVAPGDTLSGIAYSHGASLAAVESANPQIADPNLIYPGQVITVPAAGSPVAASAASAPAADGDSDTDGDSGDAAAAPVQAAPAPVTDPGGRYYAPAGTFQQCVIARESGGNPGAVNPVSGAGGLYQFLPSTWAALGFPGLPQDAPVSVQNEAFARAYAQSGTAPWAPYDGC